MSVKTINLKGKAYAPVDERLRAFHKDNPSGSIVTSTELKGDKIIVAYATVILDVDKPNRKFTGSALGEIGREKAFEKLETVAVGRALAFAGYLADGNIASAEEMERLEQNNPEKPWANKKELDHCFKLMEEKKWEEAREYISNYRLSKENELLIKSQAENYKQQQNVTE